MGTDKRSSKAVNKSMDTDTDKQKHGNRRARKLIDECDETGRAGPGDNQIRASRVEEQSARRLLWQR